MQENLCAFNPELRTQSIQSKTEALTYAISVTRTADGLHLDKAEQVFRMFVDNIKLPDVAEEPVNDFYAKSADAMQVLSETLQKLAGAETEKKETVEEKTTETETTVKTEIEKQQEE